MIQLKLEKKDLMEKAEFKRVSCIRLKRTTVILVWKNLSFFNNFDCCVVINFCRALRRDIIYSLSYAYRHNAIK